MVIVWAGERSRCHGSGRRPSVRSWPGCGCRGRTRWTSRHPRGRQHRQGHGPPHQEHPNSRSSAFLGRIYQRQCLLRYGCHFIIFVKLFLDSIDINIEYRGWPVIHGLVFWHPVKNYLSSVLLYSCAHWKSSFFLLSLFLVLKFCSITTSGVQSEMFVTVSTLDTLIFSQERV